MQVPEESVRVSCEDEGMFSRECFLARRSVPDREFDLVSALGRFKMEG
jgi:hypothetical protein